MRYILFFLFLGLSALTIQAQTPPAVDMISADELKAKLADNQHVSIIDVRTAEADS